VKFAEEEAPEATGTEARKIHQGEEGESGKEEKCQS
jgi:hypothetical protein